MTQPPYPPGEPPRDFPRYGSSPGRPPAPIPPYQPVPPYQPPHAQQFGAPQHGRPPAWQLPPPVRTSGLAIAALITSMTGLGPLAIGLGIAALISLRTTRLEGFGIAVAAVAIGVFETLLLVIAVVLLVAADGDPAPTYSPRDTPTYAPPDEDLVYVDDLTEGDCFDDSTEEAEVTLTPCAGSHDGEVVASVTLGPGAYPGDRGLQDQAEKACDREFAKYVGTTVQKTSLRPDFWAPDRDLWEAGDRIVVCATWGPDGDRLTGSVRGTRR